MYLVSCLIPVYKVEQFIERCARSLFEQSYANLEFIFVDDHSPDNSIPILKKVVSEYPDRVKSCFFITHEKNRGLAAARNTALDNANGLFVTHVDSDDWLEKNAIEILVNKQLETGADIVTGNAYMHSDDGLEVLTHPIIYDKEKLVKLQLMDTWDHVIWRRIIRRSLYEPKRIRCIEGCDFAEDQYQMTQLVYYASSYAYVDSFVYDYERKNTHSYMAHFRKGDLLRYKFQELINWAGIRDFLYDKDSPLYKDVTKQVFLRADYTLQLSLRKIKPSFFYATTQILDNLPKDSWPLIKWSTSGPRGFILHSFICSTMSKQIKRIVKHFKRKVGPLIN